MSKYTNELKDGVSYVVAVTYPKFMSYTEIHKVAITAKGTKMLSLDCLFRMSNFVKNEQPIVLPLTGESESNFKFILR